MTGKHYFRKLPQADIRFIIAGIIIFLSVLLPCVQYQRYETALKYLRYATVNNLNMKTGGTKQTMELYKTAYENFEQLKRQGYAVHRCHIYLIFI